MSVLKLSKRLETVASFVTKGSIVADIGSDHAYLPVYLITNKVAERVVAGEVADGPFETAKLNIYEHQLQDRIDVRKGNGLEVIQNNDKIDTITIAGMGGTLIATILEDGKEKLNSVKRLILQPNIAAQSIRKWLLMNQWQLINETILKEDGHIYEILVAEKGNPLAPYDFLDKELLFGPFLLKEKSQAFIEKWEREYAEWKNVYQQLTFAQPTSEVKRKKEEFIKYMNWFEEEFH